MFFYILYFVDTAQVSRYFWQRILGNNPINKEHYCWKTFLRTKGVSNDILHFKYYNIPYINIHKLASSEWFIRVFFLLHNCLENCFKNNLNKIIDFKFLKYNFWFKHRTEDIGIHFCNSHKSLILYTEK